MPGDVRLPHPAKTKTKTAKIKTDKLDAAKIKTDLLRGGYIAEFCIRTRNTMELRELVRDRSALVRMSSIMLINGTSVFMQSYNNDQ